MPNLAICCPHCGSPDLSEYRANAFVCRHCDTTFRWINPHEVTLLHKLAHCASGKNSMGVCTRCERPLCRLHHLTWRAVCTAWPEILSNWDGQRRGWFSQSDLADTANKVARGCKNPYGLLPTLYSYEMVGQILSAMGLDMNRDGDLLCFDCAEGALPDVLRAVRSRIDKVRSRGPLCGFCEREGVHERELFKGLDIRIVAGHRCRAICLVHRVACKKYGKSFCKAHAPPAPDELCPACQPWLVTRALKAVIAAL